MRRDIDRRRRIEPRPGHGDRPVPSDGEATADEIGRAVTLDERDVVEVASGPVGDHGDATVAEDCGSEPRAVMTEAGFRVTTLSGELVKIEEPLVPEIGEDQDTASVGRPVDDVVDPVRLSRNAVRVAAIRVHHPERPALVASFVRSIRDARAVRRQAVRADAIGLVRETLRNAAIDRHAPQLHRAGEVADEVKSPRIGRKREARRAARVEDPYQGRRHRRSLAWRGGQWAAVGVRSLAVGVVLACVASACAPGGGITTSTANPSMSGPAFTETVIQSGLIVPWEVVVAPDGRMFVTERPGTLSVFESTAPMAKRVASIQVAGVRAMGEAGLLGLALDPDFPHNQFLYVCASRLDQGEWRNEVLRYRASASALAIDTTILRTGIVASGLHDGCRVRFGPDGKLWIATGDGGLPARAQDATSLNGKVLRLNVDGTVPSDNPTLKGQSAPSAVYALGLRNPGGMAFDSRTGPCLASAPGSLR